MRKAAYLQQRTKLTKYGKISNVSLLNKFSSLNIYCFPSEEVNKIENIYCS